MSDGTNLSPADIMAMSNNADMNGNSLIWFLAIIFLCGMGNGGNGWFGNGGYRPQYATQTDVQNGFNFADLQDQNRDIINAITNGTAQAVGAANQAKYDNLSAIRDAQTALGAQISDVRTMEQNILANQNDCCGSTKMLIAEQAAGISAQIAKNMYDTSMQMASMEQRLTAKMDANTIQDLRDKVNRLELGQATAGVVRYPNSWTFNAGQFPQCFCSGCNG